MKAYVCILMLCLPLRHLHINSAFGYRVNPVTGKYQLHGGVDLQARRDTVFAILNGTVRSAGFNNDLGFNICLQHGNIQSTYGHLREIMVGTKDSVRAGQPIGISGSSGRVTGEHLHFCLKYRGRPIDPINFLYELLIKKENEQKLQITSGSAFGEADHGN
ncbi:M23 family metallopeptidase [Mucilaginibacter celer]|uniref:M23 family metallopeptidase n=1 Tax=Mucilaginibacter celer TaxID=2305508 RepID=A0A494VNK9_9SPHI|nr:M23 family metallopeptidase [Mucilaginibacter celer]AYL95331.1 M23 family metallopeptidase [Mucilaginibacter celer]